MKKVKIILTVVLSVVLVLSPLLITCLCVLASPNVYEDTIYAELGDKFSRLNETGGEKIVVVGGSSVAFGLDSALLEEYLGMPVVNFGLYAALGTKMMLDLSLSGIGEGDVVVLAPEMSEQTLSLYFNSGAALSALASDYSMARYLRGDNLFSLLGGLWAHAADKLGKVEDRPTVDGIYKKDSFNEYGDIKAGLREQNVMQLYYDPTTQIQLSSDIFSPDFIDYLNDYAEECERRGATVYFSFCPMNSAAITNNTDEAYYDLVGFLNDSLDFEVISLLPDYIYDRAYFYDTNFHLNDTGVILRTKKLAQDLLIARGEFTHIDTAVAPPPLPEADTRYFGEEDENAKHFTYEKMDNGAWCITGLTEEGRALDTLTLPLAYDGYKVTAVGDGAFAGSSADKIIITENTNVRNLLDGSFRDTGGAHIYVYYTFTDENEKLAPPSDFFGTTVHVPENSIYFTHYDWQDSSRGFILIGDLD